MQGMRVSPSSPSPSLGFRSATNYYPLQTSPLPTEKFGLLVHICHCLAACHLLVLRLSHRESCCGTNLGTKTGFNEAINEAVNEDISWDKLAPVWLLVTLLVFRPSHLQGHAVEPISWGKPYKESKVLLLLPVVKGIQWLKINFCVQVTDPILGIVIVVQKYLDLISILFLSFFCNLKICPLGLWKIRHCSTRNPSWLCEESVMALQGVCLGFLSCSTIVINELLDWVILCEHIFRNTVSSIPNNPNPKDLKI